MPQTKEHLKIIRLLRAPELLVVVTKTDMVDSETLEIVLDEVADFIAESGFPDAPIIPVSNATGEGIPRLRRELDLLLSALPRKNDQRAFRMNIERNWRSGLSSLS